MTKIDNINVLKRQLSELEICISRNQEGLYTVYTEAEPLFCYDAISLDEANALASDTLSAYAARFYDAPIKVKVNSVPCEELQIPVEDFQIPVEEVHPVSRLQPVFDEAA